MLPEDKEKIRDYIFITTSINSRKKTNDRSPFKLQGNGRSLRRLFSYLLDEVRTTHIKNLKQVLPPPEHQYHQHPEPENKIIVGRFISYLKDSFVIKDCRNSWLSSRN